MVRPTASYAILPGAIGDEMSALSDSFQDNLLAPPVTPNPKYGTAYRCLKYCCPATTRPLTNGAWKKHWKLPAPNAPIYWTIHEDFCFFVIRGSTQANAFSFSKEQVSRTPSRRVDTGDFFLESRLNPFYTI